MISVSVEGGTGAGWREVRQQPQSKDAWACDCPPTAQGPVTHPYYIKRCFNCLGLPTDAHRGR